MDENEKKWLLDVTVRKNVAEYRESRPQEVVGMTDEQVWEYMRNQPFTVEMFTQYMTNSTLVISRLMSRVQELEEKMNGLFNKEGSNRESSGTPDAAVKHTR